MTSMVPEIIDFDHNENILAREPVLRPAKQTFYAIIAQILGLFNETDLLRFSGAGSILPVRGIQKEAKFHE